MIIKTLVENTSITDEFKNEHGLSLYIETNKHKILFDLGASELFLENAKKMKVDITEIDIVVISHGHYDHGGGLKAFLKLNKKALIYLNEKAFDKHYFNRPRGVTAYIGLDEELLPNDQFVFVGEEFVIDEELALFSNVTGTRLQPSANEQLRMEKGSTLVQDDFAHEQNLVIKEGSNTLLVAGCAHNGIVNIIDHFNKKNSTSLSHVISGFHLYNNSAKKSEDPQLVGQIGEFLVRTSAEYHTCHCTGLEAYYNLKEIMKEKIHYLATGITLTI